MGNGQRSILYKWLDLYLPGMKYSDSEIIAYHLVDIDECVHLGYFELPESNIRPYLFNMIIRGYVISHFSTDQPSTKQILVDRSPDYK